MRKSTVFLVFLTALALSTCGVVGDGDSGEGTQPPASVYTPPAHVVAAKQLNYATFFYGSTGSESGFNNAKKHYRVCLAKHPPAQQVV